MVTFKKKIIISFMGVDGTGKTTLSKKLQKVIQDAKYLHLKPYILFLDRRTVIKNPHYQKKSSYIISFLRLLTWLISYKVFFFINRNKKTFIFDRYAHDILIDPLRYKHSLSHKFTKFFLYFFPKPNLWIFLVSSLKTIKSRKFELPDRELKRQISDYSKFFKTQKNVLKLDTRIKKEKLIKQIVKKINNLIK